MPVVLKNLMNNEEIEINDSEELYERLVLTIDKGQEPLRIDKFLMTRLEGATRSKIQRAIDDEMVLVNDKGVKTNYKVKPGDRVVVQQVSAGDNATVQPVVSTTDSGNTIIWLVDQPSDDQKKHKKGQADQDEDNEEDLTAPRHDPLKGGNL